MKISCEFYFSLWNIFTIVVNPQTNRLILWTVKKLNKQKLKRTAPTSFPIIFFMLFIIQEVVILAQDKMSRIVRRRVIKDLCKFNDGAFLRETVSYFRRKDSVMDVWQSLKYASALYIVFCNLVSSLFAKYKFIHDLRFVRILFLNF